MVGSVGRVLELWRYPVKGLVGESVSSLALDGRGVVGDRAYAVRGADGKFGSAKTTRRFRRMPRLLEMRSSTGPGGSVSVETRDGWIGDAAAPETAVRVSEIVGEPVSLCLEGDVPHLDDGSVHLLTTASLGWLQARVPRVRVDRRRFRPNLLIDCEGVGPVEEAWIGAELCVGSARLRVDKRTLRCVTTALAQEDLEFAPSIPRQLERGNEFCFGVYATVLEPGVVRVTDAIKSTPAPATPPT